MDLIQRLSIRFSQGTEPLPSRLFHLTRWILNHIEQPVLAWWVARQYRLHSRLYEMLKREVEDSNQISENVRNLWIILFESLENGQNDLSDLKWFQVERRIKVSGWTSNVLRV